LYPFYFIIGFQMMMNSSLHHLMAWPCCWPLGGSHLRFGFLLKHSFEMSAAVQAGILWVKFAHIHGGGNHIGSDRQCLPPPNFYSIIYILLLVTDVLGKSNRLDRFFKLFILLGRWV
jgi:hypothetical protein